MRHATSEHTGLLRMGLEVEASVTYWNRALAEEAGKERLARAIEQGWYPELSAARLKYLLAELDKRFPSASLGALKAWGEQAASRAPLICHWHLQWSDPLYRDFMARYLVAAWARPESTVGAAEVDGWLAQRLPYAEWSASTRRRLANGLVAAAGDAGFLKGSGRQREVRTVTVDAASLQYLRGLLATQDETDGEWLAEEILLSGTVSDERPEGAEA